MLLSCNCRNCNDCIATAGIGCNSCKEAATAETHYYGCIATVAISFNVAAAAETYFNGCIATAAVSCNTCNEAAAAETQCNSCIATAAISCNSYNEAAAAETATVAMDCRNALQ